MTRGLNPRHHFEPLSALHHSLCSLRDILAWSHYHEALRTIKDVRLILSKSTHQLKLGLRAISASFLICLLSGAIHYLQISQIMYWEIRGHESLLNSYHVARRPQLLLNMFSLAFLAKEKFISIEMSFRFCIIWVMTLIWFDIRSSHSDLRSLMEEFPSPWHFIDNFWCDDDNVYAKASTQRKTKFKLALRAHKHSVAFIIQALINRV